LFVDKNTGGFDLAAARTWMNNLKKNSKPEDVQMIMDQLIRPIESKLMNEKYTSLIAQGSYAPTWLLEKNNADNATISSFSFLNVPYTNIADSTIKISNQEIDEYVSKHKDDFKQEHVKGIAFVGFSSNPTRADSLKILNQITALKAEFISTPDAKSFVTRNNTALPFFDGYALKSKLQMSAKDSIIGMSNGTVIGPYLDGGSYVLAKKIETKNLPDSVKCRHILVGTVNPQTGEQKRGDSAASKRADSILAVIKSGGSFGALATTLSDDDGSKAKAGEYDYSSVDMGNLPKEFADYIFYKSKGSIGVVKTSFGYHIIEVLNQKNFEDAYKVAYLSKNILSSEETDAAASSAAVSFVATSRDIKSFEETVAKTKLDKSVAENIKEMDYSAGTISSRLVVKWVFENKVGTVSEPFDLKDQYIVAVITNEIKEGTQPASVARVLVEPTLRNKKKGEIVAKRAGSEKDLQKLATLLGGTVAFADSVKFSDPFVPNLGTESKVIGAAFNKKNLSTISELINGQNGLYFVKVNQIGTTPSASVDLVNQKKSIEAQIKQFAAYSTLESLKKSIKIVDKRREAGY
jgi:peptidyl-prolyl cis-trans isomerase D